MDNLNMIATLAVVGVYFQVQADCAITLYTVIGMESSQNIDPADEDGDNEVKPGNGNAVSGTKST